MIITNIDCCSKLLLVIHENTNVQCLMIERGACSPKIQDSGLTLTTYLSVSRQEAVQIHQFSISSSVFEWHSNQWSYNESLVKVYVVTSRGSSSAMFVFRLYLNGRLL